MITRIETSKLKKILDHAEQNANFEVEVSEMDRGQYSGSLDETLNFNGEKIVLYCDYDVEGTWTQAYISTFEYSRPSEWVFSREGIYCAVLFIDDVEIDLYPDQQLMLDNFLSKKCYSEYSY
jgi:protein subunit release factor B